MTMPESVRRATQPASSTSSLRLCVRRGAGPGGLPTEVTMRVPSDISCVEEVVDLLLRHCCSGVGSTRRFRFVLRVVIAEALANAIIAGNGEDRTKVVLVKAELLPDRILLHFADEGVGFDPACIADPLTPDDLERPCGRGLYLLRKLADDVQFNRQGNCICLTLRRR